MNEWISVKDDLPEDDKEPVMVWIVGVGHAIAYYLSSPGEWYVPEIPYKLRPGYWIQPIITHWQLLPEPPKTDDVK